MSKDATGWAWVAGQAILILALIVTPGSDAWPTGSAVRLIGNILFFGGLIFMGIAALRLGTSLTPTPVPLKSGSLKTTGLYQFMRHPIYTGVLVVVLGMTVPSGNFIQLFLAALTFVFFDRKAAWEEDQLRNTYPNYPEYAAQTSKFFPGLY